MSIKGSCGWFVWVTEYPDDGAVYLMARTASEAKSKAAKSGLDTFDRLKARKATHGERAIWYDGGHD